LRPQHAAANRGPFAGGGQVTRANASQKAAGQTAEEGAELATGLGMTAEPMISSQTATTAHAILAEADPIGARAIVMGSRGLTG
jgi:hypothetical protein